MHKLIVLFCFIVIFPSQLSADRTLFVPDVSHQVFRDQVVDFVRAYATEHIQQAPLAELNQLERDWDNHYQRTNWQITIKAYFKGDLVGIGTASGKNLTSTLRQATMKAIKVSGQEGIATVDDYYFRISFAYHPSRSYSLVDYDGRGLEVVGNRVAVRQVDTAKLAKQIDSSLAYLLRQQHPKVDGFFKFYNADTDEAEDLLRTTYSATVLYSLLKLHTLTPSTDIEKRFDGIAKFLLDRQLLTGPHAGGFDYGFNPETGKGTCRIVVGTTSKSIYTLLLLNQHDSSDKRYLNAARAAGNWLLGMIKDDGNVIPVAKCKEEQWRLLDKQSFLYTGQVLSALSRLYQATGEQKYLNGAHQIADLLLEEVDQQGPLLADEYRPANSISSSWVMMSLIDLAKVDPKPAYIETIKRIAEMLIERQITNPYDIFSHGRYLDAMTTSGNGWINEVMGEWYPFCKQQFSDCDRYLRAMWRTSRWLLQNSYNDTNSYDVKNPGRAHGGMITNFNTHTVRTDAVCHAMNGLISLLAIEGKNSSASLNLREQPLREILPLLRAGE